MKHIMTIIATRPPTTIPAIAPADNGLDSLISSTILLSSTFLSSYMWSSSFVSSPFNSAAVGSWPSLFLS